MRIRSDSRPTFMVAAVLVLAVGCGGPSAREVENRREFEALLTAISLKDARELEADARRIEDRHVAATLSDAGFADLRALIDQARRGDWAGAERAAYDLRERRPYFR